MSGHKLHWSQSGGPLDQLTADSEDPKRDPAVLGHSGQRQQPNKCSLGACSSSPSHNPPNPTKTSHCPALSLFSGKGLECLNRSPLASLKAGKGQSTDSLRGLSHGSRIKLNGGGGFTTPVPASDTSPQNLGEGKGNLTG